VFGNRYPSSLKHRLELLGILPITDSVKGYVLTCVRKSDFVQTPLFASTSPICETEYPSGIITFTVILGAAELAVELDAVVGTDALATLVAPVSLETAKVILLELGSPEK
jgi:hypothetical protein